MVHCLSCRLEFSKEEGELLLQPGKYKCPHCGTINDVRESVRAAGEASSELAMACKKLAIKHGGKLSCWVDQQHERGQIENKWTLRFPESIDGVCVALACEWIRQCISGKDNEFRVEMTRGINDRIRTLQAIHCSNSRLIRDLADAIVREANEAKSYNTSLADEHRRGNVLLAEALIQAKQQHVDRAVELQAESRKVMDQQFAPYTVEGTIYQSSGELDDRPCSGIGTASLVALNKNGYYLVHIMSGSGAHALAFRVDGATYYFFDANTGEWQFESYKSVTSFFPEYWTIMYSKKYAAGCFRIVAMHPRIG